MEMKNNILIVGAKGMLGQTLAEALQEHSLTLWDKEEIDITDSAQVSEKISRLRPDVIINTAAYTAVDACEENDELAMQVNGVGPGNLAQAAKTINATLVHYSTDYIFNGEKQNGYSEDFAEVEPVNAYGKSKAAGEAAIKKTADTTWNKYYIIRTAWLYGAGGPNFVDTMLKLAQDKDSLSVVNDQHGSPTYTKDLAERTNWILNETPDFGVYHVTNSGTCTWYEFAKEIFSQANVSIILQPCTSKEFPRPAKRPAYSILLNTKLPAMRTWQAGLADYLAAKK